jgi:glycosyltransferase involved in cell wall biosynthesis
MKISIITISYNQAAYLEKTICSVLEQNHPEIEYIVVDPGSTDGSRKIIDKYRDRIDKVIFEPDAGPADGLNKGLAHATGDIFGYINADDHFLPDAFESVFEGFRRNKSSSVIYGHGIIIDSFGKQIRRFRSGRFSKKRFIYEGSPICQQATFFRRHVVTDVGGFNPLNKTCWDAELLLNVAMRGYHFKRIERYLGAFRIHESSITGSQKFKQEYELDCNRYFKMVSGRGWRMRDIYITKCMRLLKWAFDPLGLAIRIQDHISSLLVRDKSDLRVKWS